MRAIYLANENLIEKEMILRGEPAHHLLKVARIKIGESVMLLNGQGLRAYGDVSQILKNELIVDITKVESVERSNALDLFLCNPKKDALEAIIRSSVEIGIQRIYFVKSEYSQLDFNPSNRIDAIVESALIQSNNPFYPELIKLEGFKNIVDIAKKYENCFYFDSVSESSHKDFKLAGDNLYLIGPEGGLSAMEVDTLKDLSNLVTIHLATPILRSSTAAGVAAGYLLAHQ